MQLQMMLAVVACLQILGALMILAGGGGMIALILRDVLRGKPVLGNPETAKLAIMTVAGGGLFVIMSQFV
jgi:hypothetical protein